MYISIPSSSNFLQSGFISIPIILDFGPKKSLQTFKLPPLKIPISTNVIFLSLYFEKYSSYTSKYFSSLKLKFINNEHSILRDQFDKNVNSDEKLNNLFQSLKEINAKLWVIEDDKRLCEKNSNFTENFIKLSRDVHFLNDDRAKIKLEMNNHTGSKIKEIKEYTSY